jgi:sulfatase maturation enzyme AslB (radical SAM superfamily)
MSFSQATIFTTALCNLNCKYCYICKDQAGGLKQIDQDIARSLQDGSYIKQILDFGDNIENTLHSISLWGGEPFLHVDRFLDVIEDWFDAFPNLDNFDTSTNFTVPGEVKKLQKLISILETKGPAPHYSIAFQISIDGYPEMNDAGRGENVTKRILENWNELCNISYNTEKISLIVNTKPTLSKETFCYLDSVEKCDKWFKFFNDEMYIPYAKSNAPFSFCLSLFNCATPTEWTSDDGKEFASICKNLAQIDFYKYEGWRHLFSTIPMADRIIQSMVDGTGYNRPYCGGSCGAFIGSIVPIPNGAYTVCHRGLFDNYVEYCNNIDNREDMNGLSKSYFAAKNRDKWLLTKEKLASMNKTMSSINKCPHQILYTDYIIFIREYARCGLIDKKYMDIKEIEATLPHYLGNSYCMQDGFIQTGSWTTISSYEIPLMYNGAMEISIEEAKKYIDKMKGENK